MFTKSEHKEEDGHGSHMPGCIGELSTNQMKQQIFVYLYLNIDEVQCVCVVDLKEVTEVKEGEQPYQTLNHWMINENLLGRYPRIGATNGESIIGDMLMQLLTMTFHIHE